MIFGQREKKIKRQHQASPGFLRTIELEERSKVLKMEQVAGVDDTPCVVDTAERNATKCW